MRLEQRFWDKVDKRGPDDCWPWTAYRNDDGYGKIGVNGRAENAHRIVILLEGCDIPSGMNVCHTCDNPGCVNPDHLFIGTQSDNIRDMTNKGRHGRQKLNKQDVERIRRLRPSTTLQVLADEYGVTIEAIRKRCMN